MKSALHRTALVCLFAAVAARADLPVSEFRAHRAEVQKDLDGVLVLFAAAEDGDALSGFRQESNFYYLTGWKEPSAILLMTAKQATLFLPRHNAKKERYEGRHLSAEDPDAGAKAGFDNVLPAEKFESEFAAALGAASHVYALPSDPHYEKLKQLAPLRDIADAGPRIAEARVKKSPDEIAAIQHATDVSIEAQLAAWKRIQAGAYEYQVAAAFTAIILDRGCERYAYAPIVGSGPNGAVLHYSDNRRQMDTGELVVMDAAAECSMYASDLTRTIPVSGHFTPRQLELYNIVLNAQKAAIAAVKPGVPFWEGEASPDNAARSYIESKGYGKYFTHKIGHSVGIDVHDPPMPPATLEPGMVITIEPGIYMPGENIGIRIEDVVLVTAKGAQVLSSALPKEPGDIEKALAR
ncbi:MAG TPA: Xaa-Pro peptidase family protein [Bryobacteraceae bacterium]|nr:Xaa-Pro peptidase family protein [Bryobacteraceae bacterium]